jgi:hypothetical protein
VIGSEGGLSSQQEKNARNFKAFVGRSMATLKACTLRSFGLHERANKADADGVEARLLAAGKSVGCGRQPITNLAAIRRIMISVADSGAFFRSPHGKAPPFS